MCIRKKLYWDGKCVLTWSILNKNKNFAILRFLSHQCYFPFPTNMKITSVSENCFYFDWLLMNNLSRPSRITIFVKVWNIAHTELQNYNRPNYKTNSELWKIHNLCFIRHIKNSWSISHIVPLTLKDYFNRIKSKFHYLKYPRLNEII